MKNENEVIKKVKSYDQIVEEIESISEGVKRLLNSRLTERAIVILIWDSLPSVSYGKTKPGKGDILDILKAAGNLKNTYLKKLKDVPK